MKHEYNSKRNNAIKQFYTFSFSHYKISKKAKAYLIIIMILCSNFAFAQSDYKKSNIKLNVLGIFFGDGNLGYERAINKKNSIQANTAFGFIKNKGFQYQLNALSISYRNYFSGNYSKGFFAHAEIGAARISADDNLKKEITTGYLWRLYGGYKHTFKKGLTLEAGLGADGLGNKFKESKYNGFFVPLYPYPSLSIGYSF
jgi:Protein of unknown function (DUF3575)